MRHKLFWLSIAKHNTGLLLSIFALAAVTQAQTYSVIHNFTGGQDGAAPRAGVTLDQAGNLYGTAASGGYTGGNCTIQGLQGCGTVFKLKHTNSGWVFSPLYAFQWTDGASPYARVVFGPDGSLYGTTAFGGHLAYDCFGRGCGVVFNLRPPQTFCRTVLCPWTETPIFLFRYDQNEGGLPYYGDLLFDGHGNIFGTNLISGSGTYGDVYQLTPSNGGWTVDFVYRFPGSGVNGTGANSGVISDSSGNLYGTAYGQATYGYGSVYELMPSGAGWMEQTLYSFQDGSDGATPIGGVVFDHAGNLYGATLTGGSGGGGTVYRLSPSGGSWTLTTLYSFTGSSGSTAVLTMDSAGNLYGTTWGDGTYGFGNVFKLTRSNGNWIYTSLHDFAGGSDGGRPYGQVSLDAVGNIYGTASTGGTGIQGVVWEIMQ